jgi:hypothetical protein
LDPFLNARSDTKLSNSTRRICVEATTQGVQQIIQKFHRRSIAHDLKIGEMKQILQSGIAAQHALQCSLRFSRPPPCSPAWGDPYGYVAREELPDLERVDVTYTRTRTVKTSFLSRWLPKSKVLMSCNRSVSPKIDRRSGIEECEDLKHMGRQRFSTSTLAGEELFSFPRPLKFKLGIAVTGLENGKWRAANHRIHSVLPQLNAMFQARFELRSDCAAVFSTRTPQHNSRT